MQDTKSYIWYNSNFEKNVAFICKEKKTKRMCQNFSAFPVMETLWMILTSFSFFFKTFWHLLFTMKWFTCKQKRKHCSSFREDCAQVSRDPGAHTGLGWRMWLGTLSRGCVAGKGWAAGREGRRERSDNEDIDQGVGRQASFEICPAIMSWVQWRGSTRSGAL
jgi:hypothetical protein